MKKYLIILTVFIVLVGAGLYINSLLISDEVEGETVLIYLGNSKMSDYTDCSDVFEVSRTVYGEDIYIS